MARQQTIAGGGSSGSRTGDRSVRPGDVTPSGDSAGDRSVRPSDVGGGGSTGGGGSPGGSGRSAGSGSGAGSGAPDGIDDITDDELAAAAGFSVAFFKHNDELKALFEKALRNDYTGDRLLAEARNTDWFKNHSESARRAVLLRESDPAEYDRQLSQTNDAVQKTVNELGVPVDGFTLDNIAKLAFHGGWNETQIRNKVVGYGSVKEAIRRGDTLSGLAGRTEREMRELSGDYGIQASDNFVANNTQKVVAGQQDMEFMQNYFLEKAMSKYAGLSKELESGMTVRQIAEPYVDSMSRLLEKNPGDINVFDNTIQKALINKDSKGNPAAKTIWQFEEDLRKDPRWMKTNNARADLMAAGRRVLRDWGLSF